MGDSLEKSFSVFVPIYNLVIGNDIGGELKVGDVTFISGEKVPRARRRLGLRIKASELQSDGAKSGRPPFFALAESYAFLRSRNSPGKPGRMEFRRIRQAVFLLASSQFYREGRDRRTMFGGPEYGAFMTDEYAFTSPAGEPLRTWLRLKSVEPYVIDKRWKGFLKYHFFPRLIPIVNRESGVTSEWAARVKRAAICAGQSHRARMRWEAFMYDMIGIEILLTRQGDRFPDALIERLLALFGWRTKEDPTPWRDMVSRLYQLRCDFVHEGLMDDVTMKDIVDADMILANLLYTVCAMSKRIRSTRDIVKLAEELQARRTLGLKPRRPRALTFQSMTVDDEDLKKLEEDRHWAW